MPSSLCGICRWSGGLGYDPIPSPPQKLVRLARTVAGTSESNRCGGHFLFAMSSAADEHPGGLRRRPPGGADPYVRPEYGRPAAGRNALRGSPVEDWVGVGWSATARRFPVQSALDPAAHRSRPTWRRCWRRPSKFPSACRWATTSMPDRGASTGLRPAINPWGTSLDFS